jgi:hypothetical protein
VGISLNSIGLYLGELILLIIKPFHNLFDYVASSVDPELPPVDFISGILILIAAMKYIKDKNPLLRLSLVCFLFNFVLFSFLRRGDIVKSYWSLGSLDWGIIGFIPGVILAANMIGNFMRKHLYARSLFFAVLVIYFLIRAWNVISYPLSCYFPVKDFCIEKRQLDWDIQRFLNEGDAESAKDVLKRVYRVTDRKPLYKKIAALRLAQILMQEGRYDESKEYLDYVLFAIAR